MRNDFTTKEVTKLIGCNKTFIPSLTSKFKKRKKPIWTPKQKGSRGRASLYTYNEMLMLACLWKGRKLGLGREWAKAILQELETMPHEDLLKLSHRGDGTVEILIRLKWIKREIIFWATKNGIEL